MTLQGLYVSYRLLAIEHMNPTYIYQYNYNLAPLRPPYSPPLTWPRKISFAAPLLFSNLYKLRSPANYSLLFPLSSLILLFSHILLLSNILYFAFRILTRSWVCLIAKRASWRGTGQGQPLGWTKRCTDTETARCVHAHLIRHPQFFFSMPFFIYSSLVFSLLYPSFFSTFFTTLNCDSFELLS